MQDQKHAAHLNNRAQAPRYEQTGNDGVRSDVENDLVGRECARPGAMHAHFKCLLRYKVPIAHDQLSPPLCSQVLGNLAFNHLALALSYRSISAATELLIVLNPAV
jgi:hypothetical protein